MIENLNLTHVSAVRSLSGLSTDVKPIKNIGTGSTFYEMNTGNTYVFSVLNTNPITNSGWWRIPIATGEGGETSMIADIDALEESATRVFVTPEQREAIGAPVFIGSGHTVTGIDSGASGSNNTVSGRAAFAEGSSNTVAAENGHAEGKENTVDIGAFFAHAEGTNNTVSGQAGHVEGLRNLAEGIAAHAEGIDTKAYDEGSHAEGNNTTVGDPDYEERANYGHAEGRDTSVQATAGHAEGISTTVTGTAGHAEGISTTASGESSHAEGAGTTASGANSHAEGAGCTAEGALSHAGGNGAQTTEEATGAFSHGSGCVAQAPFQVVFGQNNVPNTTDVMQYGLNGHNIFAVDGSGWITNGPANHSVSNKISKINVEADDEEAIEVPSDDAVYLLKIVQDTSTVLYVLADTSAEVLLGTALTDVTVAHTDDNTWTVTNADTANAVTATIKRFM